MTCEACKRDNLPSLYRHPVNNKRYCQLCWWKVRPVEPTPIDRCSDAVKAAAASAAAMAGGVVWKPKNSTMPQPIRSVVTQIINGVPVKSCDTCKRLIGACLCTTTSAYNATTELEHSIAEASGALTIVPNKNYPPIRPELHKCGLCEQISNDGAWMDQDLYWCGSCMADIEEGGGMKTKHIKLKLRGSDRAIAFFHYVCTQIDNDWPWNPKKPEPKVCPHCNGVLYVAGVLEAEEIRTIAQQAGVGKCKIPYFGDVSKCFGR